MRLLIDQHVYALSWGQIGGCAKKCTLLTGADESNEETPLVSVPIRVISLPASAGATLASSAHA